MSDQISFIIPHKGRTDLLEKTIQSILEQDYDRNKIEIIIVSQESKLDLNRNCQNLIKINIVYCDPLVTIAALRNIGANRSHGDYLIFIDADIQLAPNWLKVINEELKADKQRILISSQQNISHQDNVVTKIRGEVRNISNSIGSAALFLSKKAYQKAGGFPEQLKTCEDIYFTNRLSEIGKLHVTSKTSFKHLGEDKTYLELFKKEIWRSASNLSSLKNRKVPPSEYPSIIIPFWQMTSFLIFFIFIFLQNINLSLLAALLYFFPVFAYSLRVYFISKYKLAFTSCFWFYAVFFTARMFGTVKGIVFRQSIIGKCIYGCWTVPRHIRVSFIIPNKGRIQLLKRTIDSILSQNYNLEDIEIIVITQEPKSDIEKNIKQSKKIKIIHRSAQETIAKLRNEGVKESSGNYLAFIDADVFLSPDWLQIMIEESRADNSRVMVSAIQGASSEKIKDIEKIWISINSVNMNINTKSTNGRNLFLSKEAYQTAGKFPERLITCEDIYFTNQLSKIGKLYVTSKTCYQHLGEDKTYLELFKKEIWRSASNLSSLKNRRIPLVEYQSVFIPFWELIFSLLCLVFIFSEKFYLSLLMLALFILPVFIYSLRIYVSDKNKLAFIKCFWFYAVYFMARMLGTVQGIIIRRR